MLNFFLLSFQIWTVIFLLFVLASIGILCIETVPQLRVPFPTNERTDHKEHDSLNIQPAEPPPTGGPFANTTEVTYRVADTTMQNNASLDRTVAPGGDYKDNNKITCKLG